jgi:dGTPase
MINTLATDLIHETEKNIRTHAVRDIAEVRSAPPLAAFSAEIHEQQRELKAFLHKHLYRHYLVMRMSAKARRIISDLFQVFIENNRLLPPQFQRQAQADRARTVSDYIAGMTDRYAIKEHRRLFAIEEG